MNEPKRRYVNDLPEKLRFLVTHPRVRQRHRLSISAFSKKCGRSGSWAKSAMDGSRGTQSIAIEVEGKIEELCHFSASWPEWGEGAAAAFQERYLRELASPTDSAQPCRGGDEARDKCFVYPLERARGIAANCEQKMLRCTEDIGALRTALRALDPHNPDLRALRDQAFCAADAGDIERAKALLSRIDAEREPAVANAKAELIYAAEVKAVLGRVALLEFSSKQAAVHFQHASDMLYWKEPGSAVDIVRMTLALASAGDMIRLSSSRLRSPVTTASRCPSFVNSTSPLFALHAALMESAGTAFPQACVARAEQANPESQRSQGRRPNHCHRRLALSA